MPPVPPGRPSGIAVRTIPTTTAPPRRSSPPPTVPPSSTSCACPRTSGTELRGKVVLLNVWATWCVPCRREMPALQALSRELGGQGLRVVGVSIDGADARGDVEAFVQEAGVGFTILLDPGERVVRTFQTIGLPESFLVARDGTLLFRWRGPFDPSSPENRRRVVEALTGEGSSAP